ncbi:hypothetical protein Leryth_014561 [Lithospermum erythrorhizon]|uniref:Dirigent protein n=1 Tax=Lithospermum erythrorhizon TaxID=34254 RepID=A0AAV3RFV4_LITER|nr:hypothetical protein Leryth_014561 [Lithospermum erythrorhizon]
MLARIIFCSALVLATLVVILLAVFSPFPHKNNTGPYLALSMYVQQPLASPYNLHHVPPPSDGEALIFHRPLTEGPEDNAPVVGKAEGFIIPLENFAGSMFNIIYLTYHTHEYSGSISIQAKNLADGDSELAIVGGTGSFAFAKGHAVLGQVDKLESFFNVAYLIKLHLTFPYGSQTIPG